MIYWKQNYKMKKDNIKNKKKKIVLIFVGTYIPGYKAGGPIQSIKNLVDQLGNDFEFKIITSDRDFGDNKTFNNIKQGIWNKVNKASVYYLSQNESSLGKLKKLLNLYSHDVLYLNSFFSPVFTIKPLILRRLGMIKKVPIIIAPRGEFSLGALKLKKIKKYLYFETARLFGLYNNIIWQASSKCEEKDIRRLFGSKISVIIAPNLPPPLYKQEKQLNRRNIKIAGSLKIIFLSRISKKKNLIGALNILKKLSGKVLFDIYGPLEDKDYWIKCTKIIKELPNNIRVQYIDAVKHEQVKTLMKEHDLFFLPSFGENFGHVILEALVSGCPVLISDQTPWQNLERKGIGWDLPLNCPEKFQDVLQKCIDMNEQEYRILSERAHKFGLKIIEDKTTLNQNRKLFYKAF
jgi:glycosyltransferase involved in cell wall biosynthesis